MTPRRLYLLAELEGAVVGCGFGGPSDSPGRGLVSPRVLPEVAPCGVGSIVLDELAAHLAGLGFSTVSAHVDGDDPGSLAFARRHGFEEVDRQVEQVKTLGVRASPVAAGRRRVRHDRRATGAARGGLRAAAQRATPTWPRTRPSRSPSSDGSRRRPVWPAGSSSALAGDEIVGYPGLCRRHDGRRRGRAHGRASAAGGGAGSPRRSSGHELAFAAANGIAEIVTWTQTGNEGMRALNERLGYAYRSLSLSVRAPLPLEAR